MSAVGGLKFGVPGIEQGDNYDRMFLKVEYVVAFLIS